MLTNQQVATKTIKRAELVVGILKRILQRDGIGGQLANVQRGARFLAVPILLADDRHLKKVLDLGDRVGMATNTENVIVQQRRKWIVFEFELPKSLWETYYRSDLKSLPGSMSVGVGLSERRFQVDINWGEQPHILIAGATRVAGKSEAVKSFLVGLMENYGPDDLKIFLIDPRRDCKDLYKSAHLMVPPARTPDEAAATIDCVLTIFKKRCDHDLKNEFPVFLAVDEAETIIGNADRKEELAFLGREGGKYKIFLIIATQKPLEDNLPGLLFNLGHRMVGQVHGRRDSTLLTGNDQALCNLLTPGGDFKVVSGPNLRRCQIALVGPSDLAKLVTIDRQNWQWPGLDTDNIDRLIRPEPVVVAQPSKKVGRPEIKLAPRIVARYMVADWAGQPITGPQAEAAFKLRRTGHTLHRDFAIGVSAELRKMMK